MPVELTYTPPQFGVNLVNLSIVAIIITVLTIAVIISLVLYRKRNREYLDPTEIVLIAALGLSVLISAGIIFSYNDKNNPLDQLEVIKQEFPTWESLDKNDYRIPDTLLQRQRNHVGAVGSDICVARVDTVQNNIQVLCEPMVIDD